MATDGSQALRDELYGLISPKVKSFVLSHSTGRYINKYIDALSKSNLKYKKEPSHTTLVDLENNVKLCQNQKFTQFNYDEIFRLINLLKVEAAPVQSDQTEVTAASTAPTPSSTSTKFK
ncbi:MAG: hypothetical protein ACHQJ6_06635 [Candidatus Berkiellales bacterium]